MQLITVQSLTQKRKQNKLDFTTHTHIHTQIHADTYRSNYFIINYENKTFNYLNENV